MISLGPTFVFPLQVSRADISMERASDLSTRFRIVASFWTYHRESMLDLSSLNKWIYQHYFLDFIINFTLT